MVEWFDAVEGWGVVTSHELPGECFVHFSSIQADGFRALGAGQQVEFAHELHEIAAKSNAVLAEMRPRAQWVQSFVTDDKIYCTRGSVGKEESSSREAWMICVRDSWAVRLHC